MRELGSVLRTALAEVPGVAVHDLGEVKCGIVTFTKEGCPPEDMAKALHAQKMNISVSQQTSAQLDLGPRGLRQVARASVHYYNIEEEIARFVGAVAAL